MNTQTYTVNIRTGVVNITRVDVSQGDTGRTFVFSLYDGLIPFTPPTGSTVTIVGRKPSGLGFNETCTVSGNTAAVNTTLAMTQESGKIPVELRIESDTRSIGTANFVMHVEPSPHPDGTTDGTTEEARTVLEQCEQYAQAAQEAAASAAQGVLESIREDYSDLSANVSQLRADLDDVNDAIEVKTNILAVNGAVVQPFDVAGTGYVKYTDGTAPSSSKSSHTNYIDVSMYASVLYKRQKSTTVNSDSGIAFYDADKNYISGVQLAGGQPSDGYQEGLYEATVPCSAVYARFSIYTDTTTYGDFELYGKSKIQHKIESTDESVIKLTGEVVQMSIDDYIIGTFHYVDNGQMKTSASTSRMCYKNAIHLNPGDIVWLDYRLEAQLASLVYTTDGGKTYTGFNSVSPYIVVNEGDYYISARYIDNRTLSNENSILLANGIKVRRGSGNNAVVDASNWVKDISVGKFPNYRNDMHLIGLLIDSTTHKISQNSVHKSLWVKLLPNTTYTITQRLQITRTDAPRFALFNEEPKVDSVGINYIEGTYNAKSFSCTFTTSNEYIFAFLKYYTGADVTIGASVLDSITISISGVVTEETQKSIDNAKHIPTGTAQPLSIIHFSDIHEDKYALWRIMAGASNIIGGYDDAICTGDMARNTGGSIESWWDENVLTCIGNHDSATYASDAYNWTGISMADREAYYISPFKSNWGITHTSGTSYYYKDYTTQKVRLIVMDAMLYNDNGAEATAQTAWLENLLADAITNNLHVIIAIHAPHGGATAVDCSFSKYGAGVKTTQSDCNTPQTVIDTVAAKITNGLNFIGYIVGHMHQDNIWDAEGDGKQLMYCITCAAVAQSAQWKDSDQNRQPGQDAYNVLVIDTNKTLVKIIRCGGADIDDHMRTRKAICIDYSTGNVVGEVL